MGLNKQTGNMYPFVSHTWNPIRGKCPHDCAYCYMKGFNVGEYRLVESELKTPLGEGNYIFVGSSTDMWLYPFARREWLEAVLRHCMNFYNRYLFQTKAPDRFAEFPFEMPWHSVLGTTLETNRLYDYTISKAPPVGHRVAWMKELGGFPKMVSIEPIMDFDLDILVDWIGQIEPQFVSIGADSKGHNLPEPTPDKVRGLIVELKKITKVYEKSNLNRLLKVAL